MLGDGMFDFLKAIFSRKNREEDGKVFVIVGLGNPEKKYFGTRHNVGFDTIDYLSDKYNIGLTETKFKAAYGKGRIGNERVILVKPLTYMKLWLRYVTISKLIQRQTLLLYPTMWNLMWVTSVFAPREAPEDITDLRT